MIFYDIDLQVLRQWDPGNLYFHAFWHRDTATQLEHDFEILPHVTGKGKYLRANLSVLTILFINLPGGVKAKSKCISMLIKKILRSSVPVRKIISVQPGAKEFFKINFQGCLIGDAAKDIGLFTDTIYPIQFFHSGCQITIQQIGGNSKDKVKSLMDAQVSLIPITVHKAPRLFIFIKRTVYNPYRPVRCPMVG